MEKYNLFDESIKNALDDFIIFPDDSQKDVFLNHVEKIKSNRARRKKLWIFSGLIILLLGTTIVSFSIFNAPKITNIVVNNTIQKKNPIPSKINKNGSISKKCVGSNPEKEIKKEQKNHLLTIIPVENNSHQTENSDHNIVSEFFIPSTTTNSNFESKTNIQSNSNLESNSNNAQPQAEPSNSIVENNPELRVNSPIISEESNIKNDNKNTISPENKPDTATSKPQKETVNNKKNKSDHNPITSNIKDLDICVSVFYRPEVIYNIIENDKYIHNAGLEFTFHPFNPRYVIRTGIGLSISKGYYEYQVDYNKYLGSYNSLDSVSFSLAQNGFNLIPEYHFSNEDVYNESLDSYYTKIYKKFIYLQIPLEIGYDFYKKNTYSLGVRTGPLLSVLVNQESTLLTVDPGKDKIIQINQITPQRIAANWQYMIGFNISKSVRRFVFEIEPRFTYYFNSVYEKGDQTQSPYSFNIRLAIGIK
ncbi:MAG: outer membrane protein beta-barrel domain [Bacteroidetes bacterium]|nr:outer membrane protein beta-barrel domain [Bacteroidota bacterium]